MKLLILGGHGMAGHMMLSYFRSKPQYQVLYTSRNQNDHESIFLDVSAIDKTEEIIANVKPDIIINCVGILNHHAEYDPIQAIKANSLLPHLLVRAADQIQAKVIHISTDCVYLGDKGSYTENDVPDGSSAYALTKRMGEIVTNRHLTVRTSIIGPELKENGIGLFLWFMKQAGDIKGYQNVMWNGVTTLELAKAAERMIEQEITGIIHLGSGNSLSKYDLLKLMQEVFEKKDVVIHPDTENVLDRTVKSIKEDFQYSVPPYRDMLMELKEWMEKM